MLYVTTRSNRDAFTAQRTLSGSRTGDGGFYVPFREPSFTQEEILEISSMRFSKAVAHITNILFNSNITGWDVEFCTGRYSVRLEKLSHRILIGECWHNPEENFSGMVKRLVQLVRVDKDSGNIPGEWFYVGVRIAVLFGIFGELIRAGFASFEKKCDVSVVSGDFSGPMSVWYARKWGLPIGNIVCCCNDNNSLWELMHQGQLHTDAVAVTTETPEADIAVPTGLERLIHACGGHEAVTRFVNACHTGTVYHPGETLLNAMREGLYVSVISQRRMHSTIPSAYGTNQYLLSPYGALAYAGLMDYRARTGSSRYGLVLCEKSPALDLETIASTLHISVSDLKKHLDQL